MGSNRRRLLNRSTQANVADSTASRLRHRPQRWITSVLKSPITDSARAFGQAVAAAIVDGLLERIEGEIGAQRRGDALRRHRVGGMAVPERQC
jgi:hypothetical protein